MAAGGSLVWIGVSVCLNDILLGAEIDDTKYGSDAKPSAGD